MKKIAILGGTFDPPHNGHLSIISTLLNQDFIDEVWLIPAKDRLGKKFLASDLHRLNMLKVLVDTEFLQGNRVKVKTYQLDDTLENSTTILLLNFLKEKFPEDSFYFAIGSDNLTDLPSWDHYQKLVENFNFLVVARSGVEIKTPLPQNFKLIIDSDRVSSKISSTVIRELLEKQKDISGLIPQSIKNYIARNGLYIFDKQKLDSRNNSLHQSNPQDADDSSVLFSGQYFQLKSTAYENSYWEYIERTNSVSGVVIMPFDNQGNILFIEQYRPAVRSFSIEFPAGLVGDEEDEYNQDILVTAKKELEEETGHTSGELKLIATVPTAPGMSSELLHFFIARDCYPLKDDQNREGVSEEKVYGTGNEKILLHKVPVAEVETWLEKQSNLGKLIESRIYMGLWLGKVKGSQSK